MSRAPASRWPGLLGTAAGVGSVRRQTLIFLLDAALISLAWYGAFSLRFEGRIPPENLGQFWRYLAPLLAVRLLLNLAFGIHRWSFRLPGLHEAVRLTLTTFTGSACFTTLFYFMQREAIDVTLGPPRLVIVIEFFLTTTLLGAFRFSPRLAHGWFLEQRRSKRGGSLRTLIVGAGSAGELLIRDLLRSDEHPYEVVGFVDDDRAKQGISLGGRPVLGTLDDIPWIGRTRQVESLLFAIPKLPAARIREVLTACGDLKLQYRILPVSFTYLRDRMATTMLQDLAPDDLLQRLPVAFDSNEMLSLIRGRQMLVVGAAGSIGSQICRQVARYGPRTLVLVDIDENDLYFLYRELQASHPDLVLAAEVADIRDAPRLQQLLDHYKPQDVFHAAAHKHVPLMEYAPEEAVKNNVIGTLNLSRSAGECGVERFVLISTDKAVNPSSVMGATKRVAELTIWHQARRYPTAFTAVRFGNVLESRGSVVPLFKAQIAAGGPVTVTDPECRRYLMTIPEAVGLVLIAGLGRYGDLCILEMGEPIRILDLARMLITMSGRVPERDVPIVFTGLRPGEKLDEELMTEDEARGCRAAREMIRAIEGTNPPAGLEEQLRRLEAAARSGDRAAVVAELCAVVPEYTPHAPWDQALGLSIRRTS